VPPAVVYINTMKNIKIARIAGIVEQSVYVSESKLRQQVEKSLSKMSNNTLANLQLLIDIKVRDAINKSKGA